jgi:hypothetical protein
VPSATIHARFAATATRLIDKHGRALTLISQTRSGPKYNPTITNTSSAVFGVQTQSVASEIDGDLVKSTDTRFLIDSAVPIAVDMRLNDGLSVNHSVVSVDELKPGMTSILYRIYVRGGGVIESVVDALTVDSTSYTADSGLITVDATTGS